MLDSLGHQTGREIGRALGRVAELQRFVDGRASAQRLLAHQRKALATERAWLLSEVEGFKRGLTLVGAGAVEESSDAARPLQQRLEARLAAAADITEEIDQLDGRIAEIEAEIAARQDEMIAMLRPWATDANTTAPAVRMARPHPTADPRSGRSQIRQHRTARTRAGTAQASPTLRPRTRVPMSGPAPPRMWSPTAVMAYRFWYMDDQGFSGVWHHWLYPHATAECNMDGEIPHTDGRCAEVAFGCGIYAAKSLASFAQRADGERDRDLAFGLVGLEGKVVEHERGYRGEKATVLSMAWADRKAVRMVDGPVELAALFANPAVALPLGCIGYPRPPDPRCLFAAIREFLEDQARRYASWTSAKPNESST